MTTDERSFGTALLCTFPFWLYVDTTSPPVVQEVEIERRLVRFYAPIRTGAANFMGMPHIHPGAVPFLPQTGIPVTPESKVIQLTTYPNLGVDAQGKAGMTVVWGDPWQEPPVLFPMDSLRLVIQRTVIGFEKPIDAVTWADSVAALGAGDLTPEYDLLL